MVSGYEDSAKGVSQSIADFWLGKGPNGTEASVENPSMQDRLIAVWKYIVKYIVQRYANESGIAGYDLFNEPAYASFFMEGGLTPSQTATYLYSFYNRLIDGIRTVDPYHVLFYEPVGRYGTDSAQLLDNNERCLQLLSSTLGELLWRCICP